MERKSLVNKLKLDDSYYQSWSSIKGLVKENDLKDLLKSINYNFTDFKKSLQEPDEGMVDNNLSSYYHTLLEILNSYQDCDYDHYHGLGMLYDPFITFTEKKILDKISELSILHVNKDILGTIRVSLYTELFNLGGKVQALELKLYKSRTGLSGNQGLKEFTNTYFSSKESILAFLEAYPTLARLLTVRTIYMTEYISALLLRVENNLSKIKTFLSEKSPLCLQKIKIGIGDSHEKGNTVSILTFNNHKKLVYKPRSQSIAKPLGEFFNWFNLNNNGKLLKLNFLPKGIYEKDYAFIEFVSQKPVEHEIDFIHFYERFGYLLLFSYILNMNDLHLENIVASKDTPIIIDIETIFQNKVLDGKTPLDQYYKKLNLDSIKSSCLLPMQMELGNGDKFELSAFNGGMKSFKTDTLVPVNVEDGDFHYEVKEEKIKYEPTNIPLNAKSGIVNSDQYKLAIIDGFSKLATFILDHKQEVRRLLLNFKGYKVRILTKATEKYSDMLRYANHPKYNKEMKYREHLMFNILAYPYKNKEIIFSEVNDLLFNDIPYFSTMVDSLDIFGSDGKRYANYFTKTGLQIVLDRFHQFNYYDYLRQKSILQVSLGISKIDKVGRYINKELYNQKFDEIEKAEDIALEIINSSYIEKDRCTFETLEFDNDDNLNIQPTNETLYNGLSGISLFFNQLYRVVPKQLYKEYEDRTLYSAIEIAMTLPISDAYTGYLAPLYPILIRMSEHEDISTLEERYFTILNEKIDEYLQKNIENSSLDYISGLSGILHLLVRFNEVLPKKINSTMFNKICDRFMNLVNEQPLNTVGMAHGLSGIAIALKDLGQYSLMRTMYSREESIDIEEEDICKWCWGKNGILQSKLFSGMPVGNISDYSFLPKDDTLCHGTAGVLVVYKNAYKQNKDVNLLKKIRKLQSNMVSQRILNDTYRVDNIGPFKRLGLFNGIAGIGLSLIYGRAGTINPLIFEVIERR